MSSEKFKKSVQRDSKETGAIAILFGAILVPLLFFLFSISLDVKRYFIETRNIQRNLDFLAIQSAKSLPYKEQSKKNFYKLANEDIRKNSTFLVKDDALTVSYSSSLLLSFPSYFGISQKVPLYASATTRKKPIDAFVLIDIGSSSAPNASTSESWNSNYKLSFFDEIKSLYPGLPSSQSLSEQCLNPALYSVKSQAIKVVEHYADSNLDSVGFGFYPGAYSFTNNSLENNQSLTVAREISPYQARTPIYFSDFRDNFSKDIWCHLAIFKEEEKTFLKTPQNKIKSETISISPVAFNPYTSLNYDTINSLSTNEIIWGKSANRTDPVDTVSSIKNSLNLVLGARAINERTSLKYSPKKILYLFSSSLPRIDNKIFPDTDVTTALNSLFTENLTSNPEAIFNLFYILTPPPGTDLLSLKVDLNHLDNFFKTNSANSNLKAYVFLNDYSSDFQGTILKTLFLAESEIVLSR